jgi:hypothetical protein
MPTPPRLYRNQERKPQWVCNYYPVSDNGRIFIQYVEELCERSVNCSLIELNYDEQKRIVLEAKEIVNLRNALDKIIGDRNG